MTRVIVAGAGGRMGRLLVSIIAREKPFELAGALEAAESGFVGQDAGELAGVGRLGIAVTADYSTLARPDTVTLDFTNAAAALAHLEVAAESGAAMVIGSTGFTPEMEARARRLAARTRTVIAPNMSVGVNVLMKITAEVAKILNNFDAEVLEIHHGTKIDAPSGTALALGRTIAEARGLDFQANAIFGREGITGVREPGKIAVFGLRAGDAVGDHTVFFGGQGERLELTHRAQSREGLARGALRAAAWIEKQPPGLYSMRDVLGL
ncbi:MAG TPA: 4-hydroxy-tetrahydrodipicolinate reductase [Candidatus Binataceae bacterium]|jgi:4-hydroxy-tetrahydrodipicolinate reductase|nr:4-hydroxy-tetrahydrodipicolinate reductase [Candidatus Binataceae bacterium]